MEECLWLITTTCKVTNQINLLNGRFFYAIKNQLLELEKSIAFYNNGIL
jgi:hypothetical protein